MIRANDYAGAMAPTSLAHTELERLLDKAIADHRDRRAREVRVVVPRHSIKVAASMAEEAGWSTEIDKVRSIEPDAPDMLILRLRLSPEEIGRARAAGYAAAPLSVVDTSHEVDTDEPVAASGSTVGQFASLLLAIFSADELRRFVRFNLGSNVSSALPGPNVSPQSLALAVAELCESRGHARTVDLWKALEVERPRRAIDIRRVALLFGVST